MRLLKNRRTKTIREDFRWIEFDFLCRSLLLPGFYLTSQVVLRS
jgi:hypothetical protein